jgi:hypothetical protein
MARARTLNRLSVTHGKGTSYTRPQAVSFTAVLFIKAANSYLVEHMAVSFIEINRASNIAFLISFVSAYFKPKNVLVYDTRTSTQSRRLVRRKGASWSLYWPSGANSLAHLQLKCILYVPL